MKPIKIGGETNYPNAMALTEKMKEAIGASISMARNVQSIVDSDTQMSGQARRRLSNTVREEDSMPHK